MGRWILAIVAVGASISHAAAQEPPQVPTGSIESAPAVVDWEVPAIGSRSQAELFPNFIGFLSNPIQSVDPRSLTQIWPLFMSNWVGTSPRLPDGDIQVYGAGFNLAVSERLSVVATQGGYAISNFDRRNTAKGHREGWMNLGGAVQYSLIADVENQFLLTGGLRFVVPTGEQDVFQGHNPVYLSPYLTAGKEFGAMHVLATTGYQFPVSGAKDRLQIYYANAHLDYQVRDWIYPLVEVNSSFLINDYNGRGLGSGVGFFDPGNFSSTGNVVSLAAGVNLVLVRNRAELGAVYSTSVYTQRDFDFDGLLVKMIMRF